MAGIPDKLNLALPDGHLMNHVVPFLEGAGIRFSGYALEDFIRRPILESTAGNIIERPERVAAKVIRPQDMPMHVANGNFDVAISGTDWLKEHKLKFSTSPLADEPILRMGFGKVKIVAAVHENDYRDDLSDFIRELRSHLKSGHMKIASEYVHIADDFAQRNALHPYRVIMTYGATESLIPEDCHMIVENTETGNTLRKNNLKIINILMESEGCLIANRNSLDVPWKKEIIEGFKTLFEGYLKTVSG